MAFSLDGLIERLGGRAGYRLFPRRVNFRQDEPVYALESGDKIIKKIPCAAVAVGLEDHYQRSLPALANSANGSANLHRMMTVIVDNHNPLRFPFDLEAPVNAAEHR